MSSVEAVRSAIYRDALPLWGLTSTFKPESVTRVPWGLTTLGQTLTPRSDAKTQGTQFRFF